MAKPTNAANAIPYPRQQSRIDRRMRSAVRHECRNAILRAWMEDTDEELRLALREGRARVVAGALDDSPSTVVDWYDDDNHMPL